MDDENNKLLAVLNDVQIRTQANSNAKFWRGAKTLGKIFLGLLVVGGGIAVCVLSGGTALAAFAAGTTAVHFVAVPALIVGGVVTIGGVFSTGYYCKKFYQITRESFLHCEDLISICLQHALPPEYKDLQIEFPNHAKQYIQYCLDHSHLDKAVIRIQKEINQTLEEYREMNQIPGEAKVPKIELVGLCQQEEVPLQQLNNLSKDEKKEEQLQKEGQLRSVEFSS